MGTGLSISLTRENPAHKGKEKKHRITRIALKYRDKYNFYLTQQTTVEKYLYYETKHLCKYIVRANRPTFYNDAPKQLRYGSL